MPGINNLTSNYQLSDYRNFIKGTNEVIPIKLISLFFNHHFYNDEKRFAINSEFLYSKTPLNYNTESSLNNNFNFSNFFINQGNTNYNYKFSFVNYFKKLKIATKISTDLNWVRIPFKINSLYITLFDNQAKEFRFTGLSYFSLPINFDFGLVYNFNKSVFNEISSSNINKNAFLNINYKITNSLIAELNSTFYQLTNNYVFINSVISYSPINSKISFRFVLNNLTNENEFTLNTVDNYKTYKSTINLVPRYFLATFKYRF